MLSEDPNIVLFIDRCEEFGLEIEKISDYMNPFNRLNLNIYFEKGMRVHIQYRKNIIEYTFYHKGCYRDIYTQNTIIKMLIKIRESL